MIRERPWVIGGLVSGITTVVIIGLIVATQPNNSSVKNDAIIAEGPNVSFGEPLATGAVAPATGGIPVRATSTPRSTATVTTRKPQVKASTAKARPKATRSAAARSGSGSGSQAGSGAAGSSSTKAGSGGPGVGRIQFGRTYRGRATFYAATGAGNCSFEASSNLMVAAMNQQDYENSQACGAYVRVSGPNGKVTVRITDRCPECPPGAIDLSRQAFAKIAPVSAGQVSISWKLLSPAGLSPVAYRYKSGSSQYWCAIQVRNHRNPVRSLKVKTGSTWKTLARQDYNYFLSENGAGCGGTIRVTDIYGNQLTQTGIRIAPDTNQRTTSQFPAAS